MKNNKKKTDKDVQTLLTKLISDEWFAGHTYIQFTLLVDKDELAKIADQFIDVASDEMNDHYKNLVEYATNNEYDVPTTYMELKKKADKEDVLAFESGKRGKNALFYINLAIKAEERAISTYEKFVEQDYVKEDHDLMTIVNNNYYDEVEHLSQFKFLKDQLETIKEIA